MSEPVELKSDDRVLAVMFLVVIAAPLVSMLLGISTLEATGEKRALALAPDLATVPIEELADQIDAYFRDHFAFRQPLIRLNSRIQHDFLGISTEKVIVGDDRWLFYAGAGLVEDYTGQIPFSEAQLQQWQALLEDHQARSEAQAATYLFVIAPNKATIYSEYLPSHIETRKGRTRREQLVEHLRSNSTVRVLDLTDELRSQKSSGQLYYRQDSHWNGRGRFVAYRAIHQRIAARSGIGAAAELGTVWTLVMEQAYGYYDLLGMLGLQKLGPAPVQMLLPRDEHPEAAAQVDLPPDQGWPEWLEYNKPLAFESESGSGRLLMTHDSFFRAGVQNKAQPLARHFARSAFVWVYPSNQQFRALLEKEAPDVVVEARVERGLEYLPVESGPEAQPAQKATATPHSPAPRPTNPFSSISGVTTPHKLFDGRKHDPEGFSTAPLDSPILLEFARPMRVEKLSFQLYDLDGRFYRFTVEARTANVWRLVHDRSREGQGGEVEVALGGQEIDAFRIVGLYNSDQEHNPANRVLHLQELSVDLTEPPRRSHEQ